MLYAFFLPAVISALLGSPFAVRLVGSVVLVAIPGFLLGAACYGLAALLVRRWAPA